MRITAMLTEEQLQEIQKQKQDEIEQRHRDEALQQEATARAKGQEEEEAQKAAELAEAEKSADQKVEELMNRNETVNIAFEQAGHQFTEDLETLAEKFEHQLEGTQTETVHPATQVDYNALAGHVAGVDSLMLGPALAVGLGLQYVQSHFQPEPPPETTPVIEEAIEPVPPVEWEPPAQPEPIPEPFLPPVPEDNIPTSATERHEWAYQGIGDFGTVSATGISAEQAMAEAGLREYEQFKQEQQLLNEAIANEDDLAHKESLELRQKIEIAEYNEAMCHESARIEYALADGEPSPDGNRLEGWADQYHEEAEELNAEWAWHCVRDADNYEPRDEEMAEAVGEHREREADTWREFEEKAEAEGWSEERREAETVQLQEELDIVLDMAFDYSMSSPSMSV
jgi:hypothetical protein